MTRTGTIQRWDAARAFGFIRGDGGGAEVFFHVRDWQGSHPPKLGARVRYEEIHVGGKGPRGMAVAPESGTAARPAPARTARPAASARTAPRPAASGSAAWIWLALPVWVAVLATGIVLGRLPAWVAGALLALNAVTFAVYMADKAAAPRTAPGARAKARCTCSRCWAGGRVRGWRRGCSGTSRASRPSSRRMPPRCCSTWPSAPAGCSGARAASRPCPERRVQGFLRAVRGLAGPLPVCRGGRPVCCVSSVPLRGAGVEFLRRALW